MNTNLQTGQASPQKIIHVDCDSFFASVEMLDQPQLANRPIGVGGSSKRRGVLCTCNYEARKYGIHSAMPTAQAIKLCPSLLVLPTRMPRYREISQQIRQIMAQFTDLIEPLSLDEAYLDVTDQPHQQGSATLIAQQIRHQVRQQIGITVSAGVAPNKFLAKVASDWNKPDGLFVITPEQVAAFVVDLPVNKVFGVGKVTAKKLQQMGIQTCGDLQNYPETDIVQRFGRFGQRLYQLAHGIDTRSVKTQRIRKSLSVEHTFSEDLPGLDHCIEQLPWLLQSMQQRLAQSAPDKTIKKCFAKIKFNDFTSTTIESCNLHPSLDTYQALCKTAYERGKRPVRLLGVGVRFNDPIPAQTQQLSLW